MKKSLAESLGQLLSAEDSFENPYDDGSSDSISSNEFIKKQRENKKSPRSKKDNLEDLAMEIEEFVSGDEDEESVTDFDSYLQDFMLEDEDDHFRNELIQKGRRYARTTATSKESSEIQKIYAGSEERLEKLIREVEEDSNLVQKDITHMRMARSRNYKALAEMIGERRAHHDTILSAIKEINAMTKAKVELQLKVDKEHKDESGDQDLVANRAIQNLFGMSRDALIGSYADVSGSADAGKKKEYANILDEDSIIDEKYFKNDEEEMTDEDKFLEYEGMGIEYVLEYEEDGSPIQIVAEDRNGTVIPDYPTPELTDDLSFTISEQTHSATDNLARKYKIRKV